MFKWLEAIFAFLTSANRVAEKALPSEKVQEEKFELKKPKLTITFRRQLYNQVVTYLQMHPRENIDAYVDVICTDINDEDKEEIRKALHLRFQNREQRKMKIDNQNK